MNLTGKRDITLKVFSMLLEEEIIFELEVLNEDFLFPCSPYPVCF